jgi:anti-sigma factor RsiW
MADTWTEKLDSYLDGELSASEMSALDAHVRTCPDCAAGVLSRVQLKRAVQAAGKPYVPSREFRARMQKMTAVPAPRNWWGWQLAAVAAIVVLAAGLLFMQAGREVRARRQVYTEIADLHVANLASSSPVEVVSTDRHTVKPWFEGKIPFTFNLPELQNSDFKLVGGRVTYLEQEPGAHLIFQIRKHQISVFVFKDRAAGLPDDSGVQRRATFEMESWKQGGLRYFVVGDATPEDIANLVNLLKRA